MKSENVTLVNRGYHRWRRAPPALARSLALKRLVGGLSARAYFVVVTRDIPSLRAMARSESPCLLAFCYRLPACPLGLSGRPVQRVANRLSRTTLSPDAHSFGTGLFLTGGFQRVQE